MQAKARNLLEGDAAGGCGLRLENGWSLDRLGVRLLRLPLLREQPDVTDERNILTIGDLAERYGVSAESLRVWERQRLIPAARRTPGGHRRYSDEHVRALDALMTSPTPVSPACYG